jgi:general secretion pathway protein G
MKRRRVPERRIFFPWEGRIGIRRWLGLPKVRPVLLIALSVAFVMVIGLRERRRSGVRQTRAALVDLRRSVDAYMAEHDGGCPPNLEAVAEYGRISRTPTDAWGQPFRLICPSSREDLSYELLSDGPDGEPGGLDRIE